MKNVGKLNLNKTIKIASWTVGMGAATLVILDGKSLDRANVWYHAFAGGSFGFLLGWIFARK
jgi:hypothetical protein